MSRPPAQPFIAMGIYSQNGSLAGYYAGSNAPNVTVGQQLNWHVEIENRMGSIQLVKIIFKVANSTVSSPTEATPSNASEIGESEAFIPNGDNSTFPFNWQIISASNSSGLTVLTLKVNGQQVTPSVGAKLGQPSAGFRFILELWTLNDQTGSFQYSSSSRVGSWLTAWFNVTP